MIKRYVNIDLFFKKSFISLIERGMKILTHEFYFPHDHELVSFYEFSTNYTEHYDTAPALYIRELDINDIIQNIAGHSLLIISNPVLPIGISLSHIDIERLVNECKRQNCIIIIDESSINFSDLTTCETLLEEHKHVVILRSFYGKPFSDGYVLGDMDVLGILIDKYKHDVTSNEAINARPTNDINMIIDLLREAKYEVVESVGNWIFFNNLFCGDTSIPFLKNSTLDYEVCTFPKDTRDGWIKLYVTEKMLEDDAVLKVISKL